MFHHYRWLVLDIQDNLMLIVYDRVMHPHHYRDDVVEDGTWETSSIRYFLNNDFYHTIPRELRNRISEVELYNEDNPWWGTPGGNSTLDRIFILSASEVLRYFGDSGMFERGADRSERGFGIVNEREFGISHQGIHDQYSRNRVARIAWGARAGERAAWWLRTPGFSPFPLNPATSLVGEFGDFNLMGITKGHTSRVMRIGVRPAMWIYIND